MVSADALLGALENALREAVSSAEARGTSGNNRQTSLLRQKLDAFLALPSESRFRDFLACMRQQSQSACDHLQATLQLLLYHVYAEEDEVVLILKRVVPQG